MSKVVFELETRAPVTWCPSDEEDVFERQQHAASAGAAEEDSDQNIAGAGAAGAAGAAEEDSDQSSVAGSDQRLRGSTNSNSSRTLLLKGEMSALRPGR